MNREKNMTYYKSLLKNSIYTLTLTRYSSQWQTLEKTMLKKKDMFSLKIPEVSMHCGIKDMGRAQQPM